MYLYVVDVRSTMPSVLCIGKSRLSRQEAGRDLPVKRLVEAETGNAKPVGEARLGAWITNYRRREDYRWVY